MVENEKIFFLNLASLMIFLILNLAILLTTSDTNEVNSGIFLAQRGRKTLEEETNPHH